MSKRLYLKMSSTVILFTVIVLFGVVVFYYGCVEAKRLTKKDYEDIDKQLKLLNKPYVKTIKTLDGDIYDCVDFYKQPAFDHPLLKNHNFHPKMRPSSSPKSATSRIGDKFEMEIESPRFRLDCPEETVPIKRVTRDDLIRIKPLTEQFASRTVTPNGVQAKDTHFAIIQTADSSEPQKFRGVEGILSIYNASVDSAQYTSGSVIIQNGGDSLQVGWTVNPTLNNDSRTRGFIFTNAGNSHCFNTHCPGFVSVRSDLPVDRTFDEVSVRGGPIIVIRVFIYQDENDGNWWLEVGKDGFQIGFWPKKIFSTLQDTGSYVACGGEVYSPDERKPPMGSGFLPVRDTNQDAFCAGFGVVDDARQRTLPKSLETYVDSVAYDLYNAGFVKDIGYLVLYGGPSGS